MTRLILSICASILLWILAFSLTKRFFPLDTPETYMIIGGAVGGLVSAIAGKISGNE